MNKLFTKVATLCVGLAMVTGVGVAVGASHVGEVKATEAKTYELDGTIQATGTSYNADTEVTQSGLKWIVNGNVSQNPWRIGGHKNNGLAEAGTIRKVASQAAVSSENITKVVVNSRKPANNSINPTDVSLKVGTAAGGSQTSSLANGSWETAVTFTRPSNADWTSKFFEIDFTMPANTTTTNKFIELTSIVFYYESSTPRGTLEINNVPYVVTVGDSFAPSFSWTPAQGTTATIDQSSVVYTASDTEVFSKSDYTFTAVKPGEATITLTAKDSLNEQYVSVSHKVFVTNEFSFELGNSVALHAPDVKKELASISTTTTKYGVHADYESSPAGVMPLTVEAGSAQGSFAFQSESGYLNWTSGNSLSLAESISENSSWYVIVYDTYMVIKNVADEAREIWWNNSNESPRFAAYTGKTPESSGYNSVDLYAIGGQPVVKHTVYFNEGTAGYSSEYAEGTKITFPEPTQSLIPEGMEFDYWYHKEGDKRYAPGEEFTVGTDDAHFYAEYKIADWTADEKAAFSAALDGFVPPYFVTPASYEIEGNVVTVDYNELLSQQLNEYLLNGGWTPVQTETSGYAKKDTAHGEIRLTAGGSSTTTHIVYTFVASTPVEDWTSDQKAAFSAVLDGFVPPYFGATVEEPTINENNVMYSVAGDVSEQAEAYFADGWTNEGDYFTKQSTNGVIYGAAYPSGNSTYFLFQFIAGTPTPTEGWDSTMLGYFDTILHGVVPSYDESVKDLAYHSDYGIFYLVLADSTTAETALATLCSTWDYYAEGDFYYANSDDQLGYARGYVYQMAADQYWAVLEFNQTAYESDMVALFEEHLGLIPPFFSGFPTYVWHEGEFVCEYIIQTSQLAAQIAAYQDDIVNYYGFTDLGSSSGSVFVYNGGQSGTYQATIYTYGALLQDGGALIVELYSMYGQYIGFNIYYQAQPVSIALSGEYKTAYTLGEEFSADGVVVTATMSDTTTVDVTDYVTFSGYDSSVEGEQTITVSYGNLTASYTVTVAAPVPVFQGIEVTAMPDKVVYKLGEEFDTTGLVVSAVYDIGDPVVVDLGQVQISGFDSETLGEKTITLTYEGKSTSFVVVVAESYTANDFAQLILDQAAVICVNGGKSSNKAALLSAWTTLSQYYSLLDNEEKAKVVAAKGDVKGTVLEQAMAFYDYVVNKYKLANFVENRTIKAIVFDQPVETSNRPIIAIVAATFVAITAIGVIVALKRRKSLLIK